MKKRFLAPDVFRGLTMMFMTIVNNPGDWGNIYAPLEHAAWHGWTPTDLVFPFFLFIVGLSTVFSMPDVSQKNEQTFEKILIRTLRIFLLGLFLNFFSKIHLGSLEGFLLMIFRTILSILVAVLLLGNFETRRKLWIALGLFFVLFVLAFGGFSDFETVRVPGVLQRIALVYFIISILYTYCSSKVQIFIFCASLLGYWFILAIIPVPGIGEASFEKGINLAAWIDNSLLEGHLWSVSKTWDPEGILSTIPAVATGLAGVFTGKLFMSDISAQKKLNKMLVFGFALLIVGLIWGEVFPINKALWTSSYVCLAAGLALLVLGAIYYLTEILGFTQFIKPFVIFGVNPMLVFYASGVIPRAFNMIQFTSESQSLGLIDFLYLKGISPIFENQKTASLIGALVYLLIWYIILLILDKKKIILKV